MTRPITLVYQEQAQQTSQAVEPDLDCIVVAPAYQILDYATDKTAIQVANYGTLNANNPYTPPIANTPAIALAAPPSVTAGAWVDPSSIKVYFDDVRVILESHSDGVTALNDNLLTSAGATFVTSGVAAGDTLIIANPVGPATPNLVLTVLSIISNTQLRVSTNFLANNTNLAFRIERRLDDQLVASSFVVPPVFRSSNAITILGGVTIPVGNVQRTVAFANVYVAYRAYRTDLQVKGTINSGNAVNEITANIGKIDARNPLASLVWVSSQNAGQAPISYFGVETDDLTGYTKARDALSSDKSVYAIVVGNPDAAIVAMFKADNVSLADPTQALANGVPQKFRVVIGSEELPTQATIVSERATATTEQLSGAIPPGIRRVTFATGLNFLTSAVKPGDQLILSASPNIAPLDGTYTISHINGALECEVDTAFPVAVGSAEGINMRVYRPSTGADVIALVDNRARLTAASVTYYARVAGVAAGARTIALVQDATTTNGIHSIVEVPGTSTIINADFGGGSISATMIVNALTTGAGVTIPFSGSVNLTATTSNGTAIQAAFVAAALSTGVAGVNALSAAAALDAVYIRLFDAAASFITSGVIPGDAIEIPRVPNGVFTTTGTKRFYVNQVLSEQRLEISNIVAGSYVNNSSTVEAELPHLDDRLGDNTLVTQGTIRYRLVRDLTKDQQASYLVSIAQSLRSQRAIMAWSDSVVVSGLTDGSLPPNQDGSAAAAAAQPGTYLAAVIGGMTAGLPNHQGFSRLGIAGIDTVNHSTGYFTERQLTTISEGGWFVFVQDTPEALPYAIHQLTTDPSALQTGEYSMVKNFDYLSKTFAAVLDPFLGVWNVNEETLGFMRQALNSKIAQLKLKRVARIGAPIIDASISSLAVSSASPDRVEIYMNVSRPVPLNVIGLHLVG